MKNRLLLWGPRLGFLFFCLWANCIPAAAQVELFQINSDFFDDWAPRLFKSGELAEYQSRMPDRPAATDSLPPLPWAYEIDAGQFRHHIARQGGWVWLVVSSNHCLAKSCPLAPLNLQLWLPFFDSLKAAKPFHVRYATNSYLRKQVLTWRRSLDQNGVRDPMLIISNEAHGADTKAKLRRFIRQLGRPMGSPPRGAGQYHLLFDPQGQCVLLVAEQNDSILAKRRGKQKDVLSTADIQRRAAALMRSGSGSE